MDEKTRAELMDLLHKWALDAGRRMADAKYEKDPMGKRLIEHGAVSLFNCCLDVRRVLGLGFPDGDVSSDLTLEILDQDGKGP